MKAEMIAFISGGASAMLGFAIAQKRYGLILFFLCIVIVTIIL